MGAHVATRVTEADMQSKDLHTINVRVLPFGRLSISTMIASPQAEGELREGKKEADTQIRLLPHTTAQTQLISAPYLPERF